MEKFYHVQFDTKTKTEIADEKKAMESPMYYINNVSGEARTVLEKLKTMEKEAERKEETNKIADKINAAHFSQGKMAAGFTSTTFEPVTDNHAAVLEDNVVRYDFDTSYKTSNNWISGILV